MTLNAVKLQDHPCTQDEWLAEELRNEIGNATMWFAADESEIPDDAPDGPPAEVAFNVDVHMRIERFATRTYNGGLYVTDGEIGKHLC